VPAGDEPVGECGVGIVSRVPSFTLIIRSRVTDTLDSQSIDPSAVSTCTYSSSIQTLATIQDDFTPPQSLRPHELSRAEPPSGVPSASHSGRMRLPQKGGDGYYALVALSGTRHNGLVTRRVWGGYQL
jgi:hypothetical protein